MYVSNAQVYVYSFLILWHCVFDENNEERKGYALCVIV